ncbi:hypothetical protein EYF80_030007 [Liparis tanakae]|uniref:Uncharacterized protein n=1 Tax=Liparis tanakae TaxID=230148 RepID=A0A4Z2H4J9_9TELE|nr:hypothetical protein EYF80_030007 [Liparis tanakae]
MIGHLSCHTILQKSPTVFTVGPWVAIPTDVTERVVASPSALMSVPISKTGVWGPGSMSSRSS